MDEERTDLFSTDGLKPSMADLDNLFEDSSDETDAVSMLYKQNVLWYS